MRPPRRMKTPDEKPLTGMTGALPRRPPNSTTSPTFLPGAGMMRTAVVLLFMTPMAISSAMMAAMVSAEVSPGTATMSSPTEQTLVIASSFSNVSAPSCAASIIAESSETGMKAPLIPPTALEPQRLEDLPDRVARRRRRRERQVDNAEAEPQPPRGLAPDEFAGARELEGELLDQLRHLVERRVLRRVADGVVDDAGAGHPDVDDGLGLADAVEGARHERVVLDGVGEADELGAGQAPALPRALGHLLDDLARAPHGVHVD